MASVDKRPFVEVAGFKAPMRCGDRFGVHGRPETSPACGAVEGLDPLVTSKVAPRVCHSNNGNLCEPYDFVMNGQGGALSSI